MKGTVWIEPDNTESMLYVVGQVQYVEWVSQGVTGVDPVCME